MLRRTAITAVALWTTVSPAWSQARAPATAPSSRPGAATRPAAESARPSPELLAMWKELDARRDDAVKLARSVEKGQTLEQARKNRDELIAQTRKFNALLAPVAAASPVRYGGQMPKAGIQKAIWLYKVARAVEAYNEAKRSEMTDDEFGVFAEVNAYREALGLLPVEYHLSLRDSARGHSEWMKESGTFDHISDKPGYKEPAQRMEKEGYKWMACAENIAMGQPSARVVFEGWFDSPHHHHNLVGDYVHMGVGKVGEYWTQNLGKGEPAKAMGGPPKAAAGPRR